MNLPFALPTRSGLAARLEARIDPGFLGVVMATRNGLTVVEAARGEAGADATFAIGDLAGVFAQVSALQLVQAGDIHLTLSDLGAPPRHLAELVEAIAREPYAAYVERRLFRPAGMTRTRLDATGATSTAPDLAAFVHALVGPRLLSPAYSRWFVQAHPAWAAEGPGFSGAVRILGEGESAVVVLARTPDAAAVAEAAAAEMERG